MRSKLLGPAFLVTMLVGTSAYAATTKWVLKDVKLLNGGPQYMTVLEQKAGATGGTLLINVSGAANNTCSSPNGITQMRFTWTFDKDISVVSPGEQFGASLRAEQSSTTPSCGDELSYRTHAFISSSAAGIPWQAWQGPQPTTRWDGGRFNTPYGFGLEQATPKPGAPNYYANNRITVADLEPYPDRRIAQFPVFVATPGGYLALLYIYEPEGGTTQPQPPPTGGMTQPPGPPAGGTTQPPGPPAGGTTQPPVAPPPTREVRTFGQTETRDATGRITREAATVHEIQCPDGRQIFVYEYVNRLGFRAIRPPMWSAPLGGRDFTTKQDAVAAGCAAP